MSKKAITSSSSARNLASDLASDEGPGDAVRAAIALFGRLDLVVHAAAGLADRVAAAVGADVDAWPATVVRLALGRPIEPEERTAAAELLGRHIVIHSSPPDGAAADIGGDGAAARRALVDLCRAVLNVSEFLHVD